MKLQKHELDYGKVINYFIDHIKYGNKLSKTILNNINFKEGNFYTFLPPNADIANLYNFNLGGIIPQKKHREKIEGSKGQKYSIQEVTDTREELCLWGQSVLRDHSINLIILENVINRIDDRNINIETIKLHTFKNEIYYSISEKSSFSSIRHAIRKAEQIWHFLVIFIIGITEIPKELTSSEFEDLSRHIKYIVITAYDGEGYIFWERKEDSSIKSNLA